MRAWPIVGALNRGVSCSLQVLNPGYTEARAVNGAIARNTFRYLHSSREIERPMAKKMLVHTEDDESAEKAYQLPLLRLAVDCICDEEKRADGEKLLCEHAVGFLKDRVDDVHAAISKARKEGLPVDDWRGGGAEADELSRRRYPPSERVKAKVWEKKSALQYPCSLCGTDTCLAAVELVSDGGPPAGESGDCQLRMDRMHKSGKHHRASGLRSTGGQAAASEQRASLRLADRAARPVSAESPKAAPRSQAAEIDKGEDARGEPPGSEEHGQEAGPFRNVVCPECFTDNSWEGSKKLKQLIVFPDMAVAEGYVGKPESGQAPCTCREQGLTLEETESEKMESMWRADTPAGNLWYSDCLHNKGVEVTGAGPEEQSWAKSASGKEAHVEEPAGVKTLSLDGAGILKWGGKRLGASSARAACWEGAPDAERRARELGLVPSPLSNFMLFRGKVPGLDSVLWDVRSRVDVRVSSGAPAVQVPCSTNLRKLMLVLLIRTS